MVWHQTHLLHALRQYERHYNGHRPHRGISNSRPLQPLAVPITDLATITYLHIHRRDRLGGIIHEYCHDRWALHFSPSVRSSLMQFTYFETFKIIT